MPYSVWLICGSVRKAQVRRTLAWSAQWELAGTARQGAAMRRCRWVRAVIVCGLVGASLGVVPRRASAVAARARCLETAFVTNGGSGTVSTIDVQSRTKDPADITVGPGPAGVAITPDG